MTLNRFPNAVVNKKPTRERYSNLSRVGVVFHHFQIFAIFMVILQFDTYPNDKRKPTGMDFVMLRKYKKQSRLLR